MCRLPARPQPRLHPARRSLEKWGSPATRAAVLLRTDWSGQASGLNRRRHRPGQSFRGNSVSRGDFSLGLLAWGRGGNFFFYGYKSRFCFVELLFWLSAALGPLCAQERPGFGPVGSVCQPWVTAPWVPSVFSFATTSRKRKVTTYSINPSGSASSWSLAPCAAVPFGPGPLAWWNPWPDLCVLRQEEPWAAEGQGAPRQSVQPGPGPGLLTLSPAPACQAPGLPSWTGECWGEELGRVELDPHC